MWSDLENPEVHFCVLNMELCIKYGITNREFEDKGKPKSQARFSFVFHCMTDKQTGYWNWPIRTPQLLVLLVGLILQIQRSLSLFENIN